MDFEIHFSTFTDTKDIKPDLTIVGDAMNEAGEVVANAVRAALSGTIFPGMTRKVNKPNQADSVMSVNHGLMEFIVHTPEEVEKAVPSYDMKPGLLAGPKHRINKYGQPYNIVPFTHRKANLPSVVAQMASQLTLSHIIGGKLEIRPDDQWEILRNTYTWGNNTGKQENKRYSHMYKFGSDKFITFRTVSTKSPANSWIHPGFPANPISESVWTFMEPAIEVSITNAWEKALMKPWQ